jgi:hypothetical protein
VGHTSRSSSLFRLEVSRDRVFQSDLETGVDTVWIVHMTSSQMSYGVQAKNDELI